MGKGAFYVWQRAWTPEVEQAAEAARQAGRELFMLAGELEIHAGNWQWKRVDVPGEWLQRDGVTPVLRAASAALDEPLRLTGMLAAEISNLGVKRVQLDVDAAERQLADYGRMLAALHWERPTVTLSVTLLPTHFLGRGNVDGVLAAVDEVVLQVHGIERPRHRRESYALMRRDVTVRALSAARAKGKPFRMALPTYAYALLFAEDGTFIRLFAENLPAGLAGHPQVELAAPDLPLLAELIRDHPDIPVVWFRLPVPGERLNVDGAVLATLEAGDAPAFAIQPLWQREGGAWRLSFRVGGGIRLAPFEVVLDWAGTGGEYFGLNGSYPVGEPVHGVLPERLVVFPGGCGEVFPAAIFLTEVEVPQVRVEWHDE